MTSLSLDHVTYKTMLELHWTNCVDNHIITVWRIEDLNSFLSTMAIYKVQMVSLMCEDVKHSKNVISQYSQWLTEFGG